MTEKKVNKTWVTVSIIMTVLAVLGFSYAVFKPAQQVIPDGYISSDAAQAQVNAATTPLQSQIDSANAQISDLNTQLATATTTQAEVQAEQEKVSNGYLIDEIYTNDAIVKDLSDREVSKLFDGKIDFMDDSYDAEEVVSLNGMNVQTNLEDFDGTPYLVFPQDSVEYKLLFQKTLDTSLISDDDKLTFNFLGSQVDVSEWNGNEITFSQGKETFLKEGDTFTVGDKTFELSVVLDNAVYVKDMATGEGIKINEGDTKKLSGVEIQAKEVLYNAYAGGTHAATLVAGDKVTKTVSDGDEYEEDSPWIWTIKSIDNGDSENSIGLVLNEEYKYLDEDFKPLAATEELCLPTDYVCTMYNGFLSEDFNDLTLRLRDNNAFVEIKGDFQNGLEDYNRLLVNSTGIYDKDKNLLSGDITVGNSDVLVKLNPAKTKIVIGDFKVTLDLTTSNVGSEDADYRTVFGTLVENPKDSSDNEEWSISVPQDQLESTVSVM